jgi:hypothetical protein
MGVGPFSSANIFVLDQLIAEIKTDLESSSCPLLEPMFYVRLSDSDEAMVTKLVGQNLIFFQFIGRNL